jgi:hypothetical protein
MTSRTHRIHVDIVTSLKCTTTRLTRIIPGIVMSTFQTLPDVLEQYEVSVLSYTVALMDSTLHADLCRLTRIGKRMIAETSTSIHPWCNSQSFCVVVRSRTDETPTGESRKRTIDQPPQSPSRKVCAGRTPFSVALHTSARNKSSSTTKVLVYVTG